MSSTVPTTCSLKSTGSNLASSLFSISKPSLEDNSVEATGVELPSMKKPSYKVAPAEPNENNFDSEHKIDVSSSGNARSSAPVLGEHVFMPVCLGTPNSSPRSGANHRTAVSMAVESAVVAEQAQECLELSNFQKALRAGVVCTLLWGFLVNLSLVGIGFKLLGGKDSAGMFSKVKNPFSAMMSGILATVLVQSSSTSTSIIIDG